MTVTDTTGAFTSLAGTGVSLVVRPDRYVASRHDPVRGTGSPPVPGGLRAGPYGPGVHGGAHPLNRLDRE